MFQPEINQKSVAILKSVEKDPVEASKEKRLKREMDLLEDRDKGISFKPLINDVSKTIKRGFNHLAEDTARRQNT
jgi:hypothetical protein